jgi:hypothetical protein
LWLLESLADWLVLFVVDIHLVLTSFNVEGQLDERIEFRLEGHVWSDFIFIF